MIFFRSFLFNVFFFISTCIGLTFLLPLLLMPKVCYAWIPYAWTSWISLMLKHIVGISYRIEGMDHVPSHQPVLFAVKHQSAWETLALNHILKGVVYVLKKELIYIFPFGLYLKKSGMIPLDRKGTIQSLKNLISLSKQRISEGRSIIIFPEGTRIDPGENIPYKRGIFILYKNLGVSVIPVALNSGLFWSRRSFVKRPGMITLKFLEGIPPGKSEEEFMKTVKNCIDLESDRLKD